MRAILATVAWALSAYAFSSPAASAGQAQPTKDESFDLHLATPPYPEEARERRVAGSGIFWITFDATGHVAKVTLLQSTGSKILDENTVSFVREHWTGRPNLDVTVPVGYKLDKNALVTTGEAMRTGLCRVTFGAFGRVTNAIMVKSVGSALLDKNTVDYARARWIGPPYATRDVPITYQKPK